MATALKIETVEWCFVRPGDVAGDAAWEPIRALLDATCEAYRADDVRAAVAAGDFQMWLCRSGGEIIAVMLTQLVRRRDGLICSVVFCGGTRMGEWINHRDLLTRWAGEQGCIAIRGEGRTGWMHYYDGARLVGKIWEVAI